MQQFYKGKKHRIKLEKKKKILRISWQIVEENSPDIPKKHTRLMLLSTKEIKRITMRADPYL